MHFFEETFFRGAQKKDDLQFFFIRNTSHRYIVRDLTLETKETPDTLSRIRIIYMKLFVMYLISILDNNYILLKNKWHFLNILNNA